MALSINQFVLSFVPTINPCSEMTVLFESSVLQGRLTGNFSTRTVSQDAFDRQGVVSQTVNEGLQSVSKTSFGDFDRFNRHGAAWLTKLL